MEILWGLGDWTQLSSGLWWYHRLVRSASVQRQTGARLQHSAVKQKQALCQQKRCASASTTTVNATQCVQTSVVLCTSLSSHCVVAVVVIVDVIIIIIVK